MKIDEKVSYKTVIVDESKLSKREKRLLKNKYKFDRPLMPHYVGKMDNVVDKMIAAEEYLGRAKEASDPNDLRKP